MIREFQLVIGSALLLSVGAVNASVIGFDFQYPNNEPGTHDALSYTINDLTLDITAWSVNDNDPNDITALTSPYGIYGSPGGLGVTSTNFRGNLSGLDDVDEGLLFSFSRIVNLDSISFAAFTDDDDYNMAVDGFTRLVDFNAASSSPFVSTAPGSTTQFNFRNVSGTQFLVWADSADDEFLVSSLHVNLPEPAAVALFATGLLGFGVARRRKRS